MYGRVQRAGDRSGCVKDKQVVFEGAVYERCGYVKHQQAGVWKSSAGRQEKWVCER